MADRLIRERLVAVRESLGINMAEAARRLEMSAMGYLRYERGDRDPSMQMIEVIAQRFGTSAEYLTGMTDDPAPSSLVISRDSDPELYDLVMSIKGCDGRKRNAVIELLGLKDRTRSRPEETGRS